MMSRDPYLPIARKFFESDIWNIPRVFSEAEAWLDMIYLASFADHNIDLGKQGKFTLHRGEFYCSQRQLSKRWGWNVSKVNRYLSRLSEGDAPSIEKISRETLNETPSETPSETPIVVVRLCNYDRYNGVFTARETLNETPSETPSETIYNKGNKEIRDNNTHTHYLELKNLFVSACVRACEDPQECKRACIACVDMLHHCNQNAEALAEHRTRCANDPLFRGMVEVYRCYPHLQLSFSKPLLPEQLRHLLTLYDISDIWRIMEAIENKRNYVKGSSLYQTIKQWAATDIVIASRTKSN